MDYQELVDTRRRESSTQNLTQLSPTFYTDAKKYLEELLLDAPVSDPTASEWKLYQNARYVLIQIFKYRCTKISQQTISLMDTEFEIRTSNMLSIEEELSTKLNQIISDGMKGVI